MPAVREYKTSAQIEAERKERASNEVRINREIERAYEQHKPLQVRFCADMLAAAALDTGRYWPKGGLSLGVHEDRL